MRRTVSTQEVEIGRQYRISGEIENGFINGKPYICNESVSRKITRINSDYVVCECGRKFLNNQEVKIEEI